MFTRAKSNTQEDTLKKLVVELILILGKIIIILTFGQKDVFRKNFKGGETLINKNFNFSLYTIAGMLCLHL